MKLVQLEKTIVKDFGLFFLNQCLDSYQKEISQKDVYIDKSIINERFCKGFIKQNFYQEISELIRDAAGEIKSLEKIMVDFKKKQLEDKDLFGRLFNI